MMTHDEFEASAKKFCDEFNARLAEIAMQRLTGVQQEMEATSRESRQVEPVAVVTSESGNKNVTMSWWHEPALSVGTPLYTALPQRQPLTDEEIHDCFQQKHKDKATERRMIARAIERAHGIGSEE